MKLFPESRLADLAARSHRKAFGPALDRLRSEVRALSAMRLRIPKVSAGYFHEYFCPDHAVALDWKSGRPRAHRCPVDGKVFRGQPFDGAWFWPVNTHLSRGAFKSALLWRIGGDEADRKRAGAILDGYARRYPDYPVTRAGMRLQGRCCYHSLDESVWLIPLTQAYDLIRETLPDRSRRRVEEDLLLPAARHIVGQRLHQIHNIECWHHAALAAVGVCLDRRELVDLAVDSRYGYWRQLEEGVRPDGFWYEGSTSYHFYTMAAMISLATTMSAAGVSLHRAPRLKRMFHAPLEYAYPDLGMPAMSDCWYFTTLLGEACHNTPDAAGFYEVGWAWYGEAAFGKILRMNYRRRRRDSLEALLYGRPDVSPGGKPRGPRLKPGGQEELPRASRLFPDSGYALLQTRRPSTYLLLKYGPHGGGHGHPDKLSLILHAFGRKVSPDLGTPGYGIGLNSTWYRRTLSHNTVLIDGLSQPPATGRLNRFEARKGPGAPVADASVTWKEGSYKGVTMRRMVLLRADGAKGSIPPTVYFVDVFAVRCSRPRQMDWAFRVKGSGRKVGGGDLLPCPGLEGEGYEHLANLRAGRIADGARITWKVGKGYLDLFLVGGSELFVGDVPFNPASERTDMVISRRLGKSTVFVSVFCFREGRSFVTGVRENTKDLGIRDSIGLCVEKASGEDQWIIGLQSGVLRQ